MVLFVLYVLVYTTINQFKYTEAVYQAFGVGIITKP